MATEKILLGYGEFSVDDVPVGLTRGGGSFAVETEYREVEADGDKGVVKGRIVIDRQDAKLTLNALDMFSADDMAKFYPALKETTGTITSTLEILATDYHAVKWTGKTMGGEKVTITVDNAINLENIDLTLEDKDEVVPELTYTAAYEEDERNTPPWSIVFGEAA